MYINFSKDTINDAREKFCSFTVFHPNLLQFSSSVLKVLKKAIAQNFHGENFRNSIKRKL